MTGLDKTLVGYTDRISLVAGDEQNFMVSSQNPDSFSAQLVRLICGTCKRPVKAKPQQLTESGLFLGRYGSVARPFAMWWSPALGTYSVCGVLAGLFAAALWFRWAPRRNESQEGIHRT